MELYFLKRVNGRWFKFKTFFLNLLSIIIITYVSGKIYWYLSVYLKPIKDNGGLSFWNYLFANNKAFICLVILLIFIVTYSFLYAKLSWNDIDKRIRWVVTSCVILLVWNYAFFGYNYYLNHWDFYDRAILVLALVLSVCNHNPSFLIFVVLQSLLIAQQFKCPLFLDYSFTDKSIVFSIVIVGWLFALTKKILYKNILEYVFYIMVLGIICNWYWLAGIGKLNIGWLDVNELHRLFLVTLDYNWLHFLDEEQKRNIVLFLKSQNKVIRYAIIMVELVFALCVLFNKRISILALFSFICFHFSVFISSGIFFWKWIVVEIVLILCFIKYDNLWLKLHRKQLLSLYILYLIALRFYFPSTELSWFDTGIYSKNISFCK